MNELFNVAIITYGVYRSRRPGTVFQNALPESFVCAYTTKEQADESAKHLNHPNGGYYVKPLNIFDRFINPDDKSIES